MTATGLPSPITRMPRGRVLFTPRELALYLIATAANGALALWWLL